MPKPNRKFLALCDELTRKAFEKKPPIALTPADRLKLHQDRIYKWGIEEGHYPDLKGTKFRTPEFECDWTVLDYYRGTEWICQSNDDSKTIHHFQTIIIEYHKL